jgi:hypothetical protein
MCSINHDLKAIYVHIPKNGGSFVHKILNCYDFKFTKLTRIDHKEFDENIDSKYIKTVKKKNNEGKIFDKIVIGFVNIRTKGILRYYMGSKEYYENFNMNEDKWNEYYKFTFIRNPYDKIVSAYKFINKHTDNKYKSFLEFLQNKDNCDNWEYSHAYITQYQNLLDLNGNMKINHIGNFNDINTELVYILNKIGVDKIKHLSLLENDVKLNESLISTPFYEYYDQEILNIVNDLFKEDFENFNNYENFGFKKCVNLSEFKEHSITFCKQKDDFKIKNIALIDEIKKNNCILKNSKLDKYLYRIINSNTMRNQTELFVNRLKDTAIKNNLEPNFFTSMFETAMTQVKKQVEEEQKQKKLNKENTTSTNTTEEEVKENTSSTNTTTEEEFKNVDKIARNIVKEVLIDK